MRKSLLSFLCWLTAVGLCAQTDATVVEWHSTVTVDTPDSYTWSHHRVVTVRSERQKDLMSFSIQLDRNRNLEQFSITLTDATGRQLRKVKISELERTEYSNQLADDCYYLYKDIESPVYPVTMTLDFRLRQTANVVSYPMFMPQTAYDTDVSEANYELTLCREATFQYAATGCECHPAETTDKRGRRTLTFSMHNLPPIHYEPYMPPLDQSLPTVYIVPLHFTYFNTQGSLESWQSLGMWNFGLLKSRDQLPQEAKDKVHQLTDTTTSVRQRIAVLYQLLRETTRYVSIQLGIGGYQPMPAAEVWKTGFGDCKALTNYMAALLREAGVHSIYTLISTDDKRLLKDMPNFQQLNHVVLGVPDKADTIWIECTNPQLPLGYVHPDIAGHDAVCLTPQGGRVVRLPEYADSLNLRFTQTTVALSADGSADITISDDYQADRMLEAWSVSRLTATKRDEAIATLYHLPYSKLNSVNISIHDDAYRTPLGNIAVQAHSTRYGNMTGKRIFLSLNPLKTTFRKLSATARQQSLNFEEGRMDRERLIVQLPQGYSVEAMPNDIKTETPFGRFEQRISQEDGILTIERTLLLHHGSWSAAQATEANGFFQTVEKQYTSRLVLSKSVPN